MEILIYMFSCLSDYAKLFIGTRYSWGGNTPEQGFDCSGYVIEVLRSQYSIPYDMTSKQIYKYLISLQADVIYSNFEQDDILFYGKNENSITHVSIAINSTQIIESGGEGRVDTDKGFVRVRPINHRKDLLFAVRLY